MAIRPVSPPRLRVPADRPARGDGDFVLYWMTSARRLRGNLALDHAIARAVELGKPLTVLEALRADAPYATDRSHRFVIEGMRDHLEEARALPITHHPFVERAPGEGRGLLAALAERACLVVGDDHPYGFLPRMLAAAARKIPARFEFVDGNGVLPLHAAARVFPTAFSFRKHLQRHLRDALAVRPQADPWRTSAAADLPEPVAVPRTVAARWPALTAEEAESPDEVVAGIEGLESIGAGARTGGAAAGLARLRRFVDEHLDDYHEEARHPDADASSGLSPYLHFGHVGIHQVLDRVAAHEDWSPADAAEDVGGKRSGWWGMGAGAESFLDEAITWRELGFQFAARVPDPEAWETLPDWARATLDEHRADEREYDYSVGEFERAETHDELWNAAQRQLVRDGVLHNYLRMLWGKKILEWTGDPRDALAIMLDLNHRYALDGRDPNSATGILWVLGRHDRAWGPERPVFGKVRYMSSANTARKLRVKEYLRRYAPDPRGKNPEIGDPRGHLA